MVLMSYLKDIPVNFAFVVYFSQKYHRASTKIQKTKNIPDKPDSKK